MLGRVAPAQLHCNLQGDAAEAGRSASSKNQTANPRKTSKEDRMRFLEFCKNRSFGKELPMKFHSSPQMFGNGFVLIFFEVVPFELRSNRNLGNVPKGNPEFPQSGCAGQTHFSHPHNSWNVCCWELTLHILVFLCSSAPPLILH